MLTASMRLYAPATDFDDLARTFQHQIRDYQIDELATSLGVGADALRRLEIGWDESAFTFPMRDATGRIIGIRRRFADGRKLAVKGSRQGLFMPGGLDETGALVVTEGESDCAAALTLGFQAIGRPGCGGGLKELTEFCRGRNVAIVADGDNPGLAGARVLGQALALICPSVRVVAPLNGIKDLRNWLVAGATPEIVRRTIRAADPLKICVGAKWTKRRHCN